MPDFIKHAELIGDIKVNLDELNRAIKNAISVGYSIEVTRSYNADKPPILLTLNAPVIKESETTDIGRNA